MASILVPGGGGEDDYLHSRQPERENVQDCTWEDFRLYYFARVAITKYHHRLGGITTEIYFVTVLVATSL